MSNVKTALTGYVSYRGREGHYMYLLHRITGLGTLAFLAIHILDTATVYYMPDLYKEAVALYRNPIFMLGEIALVFCLFFHGLNGLRIAIFDLFKPEWWEADTAHRSAIIVLIASVIIWLPAAGIMGYNLLYYSFGLFGGG
jgi:succinate dehydrogenase / fumarate reductase cytochrome b subunit